MNSGDMMVLGVAAAIAVGLVMYAKKSLTGSSAATSSDARNWAPSDYWPNVPYNYETIIPMQPGGGY